MKIGENIIVVEFGGDKIVALAANCCQFGRFELIAKEEEPGNGTVVRGVVHDAKLAGEKLYNMILKLNVKLQQEHLPKISDIYVLLNGMTLRSEITKEFRHIDQEDVIVEGDIESFDIEEEFETNTNETSYVRQHLGYFLDEVRDEKPIGKKCNTLSKETLNIVGAKKIEEQLRQAFAQVGGVAHMHLLLRPEALKRIAFKGQEIVDYAAIVDIGSTTTGVAIFNNVGLIHYEVIPLGGNNITRDIASFGIAYEDAERLKIDKGVAKLDLMSKNEMLYESINLDSHKLNLAIEARMTEILLNVKEAINRSTVPVGDLSEGILFTGGGSLIKDFNKVCHQIFTNISVRKMPISRTAFFNKKELNVFTAQYSTVLGAILLADETTGGPKIEKEVMQMVPESNLFESSTSDLKEQSATTPNETPNTRIPTLNSSTEGSVAHERRDDKNSSGKANQTPSSPQEEENKGESSSFFGRFGGRDRNREREALRKQDEERERQREEDRQRLKAEEEKRRQRQEEERRRQKEAEEKRKKEKDEAAKQSREKFRAKLAGLFAEDNPEE